MKIAIIYTSKYGAAAKIANSIGYHYSEKNDVQLFNLNFVSVPSLDKFDVVVLGSSIYMSKISKKMTAFCAEREKELKTCKELRLFICGMDEHEAELFKANAFPKACRNAAKSIQFFPGEYHLNKMNIFERLMLRICFKIKDDVIRDYTEMTKDFLRD